MRILVACLLIAMAAPALAGPPRILERLEYDAIYETRLGGALYDGPYHALANLKVRVLTHGKCSTPSCGDGRVSEFTVEMRCREIAADADGPGGYCPGASGTGTLEPWAGNASRDPDASTIPITMDVTFDTGVTCHFDGVDPFGYPLQGYFFAVTGTFTCTDPGGAPVHVSSLRMGMSFPKLFDALRAVRPRRPGAL